MAEAGAEAGATEPSTEAALTEGSTSPGKPWAPAAAASPTSAPAPSARIHRSEAITTSSCCLKT